MTIDAGFKNDRFVGAIWHREMRNGPDGSLKDVIVQDAILHLIPQFLRPVALEDAVGQLVALARAFGITTVEGDGHYSEAIGPRLAEHGIRLEVREMTSSAITKRIENLQTRIHTAAIDLLDHAEQTKEILAAQLVAHAGGRLTLRAPERRGAHDDLVSAILLACDAESVVRLAPCSGDVEVEMTPLYRDHATNTFYGGELRYFRREGERRIEVEPPFGSRRFIAYAQDSIRRGIWTASIIRWAESLGLEARPGLDPELLDPESRGRSR